MRRQLLAIGTTCLLLAASSAHADDEASPPRSILEPSVEAEREMLAHALKEFRAIERLIAQAEAKRVNGGRIHFDYRALRTDLMRVQVGIREYLDDQRPQPRTFEQLEASYVVVDPAQ